MEHLLTNINWSARTSASKKLIMAYWNGYPTTVAFLIAISFCAIGIIIINYAAQYYTVSKQQEPS